MKYVIFSAHYDHLGVGKPMNGDSIYNGANDDASGVTAVIMLANILKLLGITKEPLYLLHLPGRKWVVLARNIFQNSLIQIK